MIESSIQFLRHRLQLEFCTGRKLNESWDAYHCHGKSYNSAYVVVLILVLLPSLHCSVGSSCYHHSLWSKLREQWWQSLWALKGLTSFKNQIPRPHRVAAGLTEISNNIEGGLFADIYQNLLRHNAWKDTFYLRSYLRQKRITVTTSNPLKFSMSNQKQRWA